MPIYSYECPCSNKFDRLLPLKDYALPQLCECGLYAKKIITPVRFNKPMEAYQCPVTGKEINSVAAHKENLALHGCHVLETGEREEAARNRARHNKEFDDMIDKTAEELVQQLPPEKLAQLGTELLNTPE